MVSRMRRAIPALCLLGLFPCLLAAQDMEELKRLPPFERAIRLIMRYEGWHGPDKTPYIAYGHRILPGEQLSYGMSREEGEALLRKDLLERCALFRRFGVDSLLLAVLAYQVGHNRLLGYGKMPKSKLIRKLERGERDIGQEYLSFRCWKGRVIPSIERRRRMELALLYEPLPQ